MFNKNQRTILNDLSLQVYGTESAWAKLLDEPKYQIVIGQKEMVGQKYVRYQTKDGKAGTIVKLETAISKYGYQATEEQLSSPVVATESRQATFEEMVQALTTTIEVALHSQLTPEERQHVFAELFSEGRLPYKLILELGDNEQTKESFEAQVNLIPEEKRLLIKDMLRKTEEEKGIQVDAYGFASDVVFCSAHKKQAAELTASYLQDAKKRIKENQRGKLDTNLHKKLQNDQINRHNRLKNRKAKET
jgi:hypothetical protein